MPDIKQFFEGLGCNPKTLDYLGDGVYIGHEESTHQLWLVTEREDAFHHIAIDRSSLHNLTNYLKRISWLQPDESIPGEHQVVLDALNDC